MLVHRKCSTAEKKKTANFRRQLRDCKRKGRRENWGERRNRRRERGRAGGRRGRVPSLGVVPVPYHP